MPGAGAGPKRTGFEVLEVLPVLHYFHIRYAGTAFRHQVLNIFRIFSCLRSSITLSRCRCCEAKKLPRAQLCFSVSQGHLLLPVCPAGSGSGGLLLLHLP